MYLKIMNATPDNASEDMSDCDKRKPFIVIECDRAEFFRDEELNAFVEVGVDGLVAERIQLFGNAYLMNDKGNTIASSSPSPIKRNN